MMCKLVSGSGSGKAAYLIGLPKWLEITISYSLPDFLVGQIYAVILARPHSFKINAPGRNEMACLQSLHSKSPA